MSFSIIGAPRHGGRFMKKKKSGKQAARAHAEVATRLGLYHSPSLPEAINALHLHAEQSVHGERPGAQADTAASPTTRPSHASARCASTLPAPY